MQNTLFCFGLGYVAQYVASMALQAGWRVIGTHRSASAYSVGLGQGVEHLYWPGGDPAEGLREATHLLTSIPPDAAGDPVYAAWQAAGWRWPKLQWLGYLSTTGVYGDHQGDWVTEDSALLGQEPRQLQRIQAERQWQDSGLPTHLFRLSGIYGPGRSAIDQLRAGRARRIVKPGQVFSRAHGEDIAALLWLSMQQPQPGAIYNVADELPASAAEVVAHAAALLNLPPPPEEDYATAIMSPMLRSFYTGCRRVFAAKAQQALGWQLRYPTYREGLSAQLLQEQSAINR